MSIFKRKINKIWVLGASIAAISLYSLYVYKAFSNEEQINNKSEETSTIPEDYEKIAKHLDKDEKEREKETIEEVFESNEPSSYELAKEYDELAKEYDELEERYNPDDAEVFGRKMQGFAEAIVEDAKKQANNDDPNFRNKRDTGQVISMLKLVLDRTTGNNTYKSSENNGGDNKVPELGNSESSKTTPETSETHTP